MVIFDFNVEHVVCRVNREGAILVPKAIRDSLGITPGTHVELFRSGADSYTMHFLLSNKCMVCGSKESLVPIGGRAICKKCLAEAQRDESQISEV